MKFVTILMLMIFMGCATKKSVDASRVYAESKIFMGALRATRATTDSSQIKVIIERHFWAEGKLKEGLTPSPLDGENGWRCIFVDAKGKTLKEVVIPNPLKQDREYYTSDGKLERKRLELETASFVIRTAITNDLYAIKIVDVNHKMIATIPLTP
jgi:hypothetical protein